MAKDSRAPYRPGQRTGMVKVKRVRTIDAVVAGYRPGKEEGTVGSLILGLYDPDGKLHVVGHSSGPARGREARARRQAAAVRDRPARPRRPEPLEEREGARVDRPAPRARRRGHLRPHQRRPHPPRHEDPALARGQGAARLPARADEVAPAEARRAAACPRRTGWERPGRRRDELPVQRRRPDDRARRARIRARRVNAPPSLSCAELVVVDGLHEQEAPVDSLR